MIHFQHIFLTHLPKHRRRKQNCSHAKQGKFAKDFVVNLNGETEKVWNFFLIRCIVFVVYKWHSGSMYMRFHNRIRLHTSKLSDIVRAIGIIDNLVDRFTYYTNRLDILNIRQQYFLRNVSKFHGINGRKQIKIDCIVYRELCKNSLVSKIGALS